MAARCRRISLTNWCVSPILPHYPLVLYLVVDPFEKNECMHVIAQCGAGKKARMRPEMSVYSTNSRDPNEWMRGENARPNVAGIPHECGMRKAGIPGQILVWFSHALLPQFLHSDCLTLNNSECNSDKHTDNPYLQ